VYDNVGWHVCNLSVQCCYGGPTYHMARNSYIDQRNFIGYSIEALDNSTHGSIKNRLYAAIAAREPTLYIPSPAMGWLPWLQFDHSNFKASVGAGGVNATVEFNSSGAITSLVVNGDVLCDAATGGSRFLGLLVYRTHSEYDLNDFGDSELVACVHPLGVFVFVFVCLCLCLWGGAVCVVCRFHCWCS
jgi:hypothetical protein